MTLASAAVWTRATGEPRRMGTVVRDGDATRFQYDADAGDLPGLSLLYDPKVFRNNTIPWTGNYEEPLHPALMALVPPASRDNLQYRIAAELLGFTRDTPDKEWRMLPAVGHGAIGHIDVFDDDAAAARWYGQEGTPALDLERSEVFALAIRSMDTAHDAKTLDEILKLVGRAPSPGGAMPKILHHVVWPGTGERVDALIKFEQAAPGGNRHQDILVMENWAYGVHERFSLPAPRRALVVDEHGNQILATERFDRRDGVPLPLESLYCALKIIRPDAFETPFTPQFGTSPNFEMVARALTNPRIGLTSDPSKDGASLYARIVLSFLTGNGDLHLKNVSLLGRRGESRISPVYDPAPMRLYGGGLDMHTAVTFGGLRFYGSKLPDGFAEKLLELGAAFGLQKKKALLLISHALDVTANASEEIRAAGVHETIADRFDAMLAPVRSAIEDSVVAHVPPGTKP